MSRPAKWQLQQKFFKAGARLPKRGKWFDNRKSALITPYNKPSGFFKPFSARQIYGVFNTDLIGNLGEEEFRFFIGHPSKHSPYAQCRVCLEIFSSHISRREHGKKLGCCRVLTEALKVLLVSRYCLVCNERTHCKKWGVPLCNECLDTWKYGVCRPRSLYKELIDAEERLDVAILSE